MSVVGSQFGSRRSAPGAWALRLAGLGLEGPRARHRNAPLIRHKDLPDVVRGTETRIDRLRMLLAAVNAKTSGGTASAELRNTDGLLKEHLASLEEKLLSF